MRYVQHFIVQLMHTTLKSLVLRNEICPTLYCPTNAHNVKKFCIKTPTNNLPPTVSSHSSCVSTGHQELL